MEANLLPTCKTVLLKCIHSCTNGDQLRTTVNLIDNFQIGFMKVVSKEEIGPCLIEVLDAWALKAHQLSLNEKIERLDWIN